jgi:hypothetical protein
VRLASKWAEGERIDKNDSEKRGNTALYVQQQTKKKLNNKIFHYGPASILSTVSNLVFLFHPFMAATKLTNPTTWLLLYSCRVRRQQT